MDKNASETELELAKGLLKLEVEHKDNRAITNLAKSLKMPNLNAHCIMTRQTSEKVLDDAMKILNLEVLLNESNSKLENLAVSFDSSKPLTLAGHLLYKNKYGNNYGELPFINLSENTIKKYDRECVKAGVLSLE